MLNMRVSRRAKFRFVLIALGAVVPIVWVLWVTQAASRTWTGGTPGDPTCPPNNNFWTNQCNWTSKVLPVANDDLTFPGSLQPASLNTFANGTTFNSISVSGGHSMSGSGVSLDSGITASNGLIGLSSIKLNNNQTFNAPTAGTGALINSAIDNNAKHLTLGGAGGFTMTGIIGGSGGLTKSGTGTTQLVASNSYTGDTLVREGTLLVFGDQRLSNVGITGGATLGGSGAVGDVTFAIPGGTISPGNVNNGTGILTVEGDAIFPSAGLGSFDVDLNSTTVGSGYDRLKVNGTVTLGDGANSALNVNLGFAPQPGTTFTIIENDGTDAVSGTFANKPEGSSFTIFVFTANKFFITYRGGDGSNDVVLHVPTTRTWDGRKDDGTASADDKWMTKENWVGDVAPGLGDDLVFPAGASSLTNTNNFPDGTPFGSITMSANGYTLNGASLKLSGNFTNTPTSGGTNTVNLAILSAAALTSAQDFPSLGLSELILNANNTYAGVTSITGGVLTVNGNQPNSPINIIGGSLHGVGTVGHVTAGSGSIRPSISSAPSDVTLTVNGIDCSGGAFIPTFLGGAGGIQNTQLDIIGTVNLNQCGIALTAINVFSIPAGTNYTIINNDLTDPINGTFTNRPEGSVFPGIGGSSLGITYVGGDGNDVVLHVPTTRTWDGGGTTNNWKEAANWEGDVAPGPGDDLIFPAAKPQMSNNNDFPSGTTFNSIILSGVGYFLNGNSIVLNAGIMETVTSGTNNSVNMPIKLNANQTFSTAGPTGRTLTFSGGIDTNGKLLALDGSGPCNFNVLPITGGGGINRMGTGLSVLLVNNTYTGVTTISSGRLGIQGNQPNSMVNVTGGTLRGSGTTGSVNASSGKVAPGGFSVPPALTVQGSLTFSSNSTFETAVQGSAPNRGFGRLNVNGPVDLGGAALSVIPNLPLPTGNTFIIVRNDGANPINGTFNGLPEGSIVTAGSQQFTISYVGGDGNNDVVLTALPPTLFIEEGTTNRAVALDSVTFVRGPFRLIDDHNFSADHRTRVILFTSLLGLTQPDPSVLVVQAGGFNLPVENVGTLTAPGLVCSFIIVRLPDGLPPGDLPMAFTLRGVMSNTAILSISP